MDNRNNTPRPLVSLGCASGTNDTSGIIPYLITKCMTSFLVHGQLPDSLMSVVPVTIIKDKLGKINSKNNYRHIATASIMSKLI